MSEEDPAALCLPSPRTALAWQPCPRPGDECPDQVLNEDRFRRTNANGLRTLKGRHWEDEVESVLADVLCVKELMNCRFDREHLEFADLNDQIEVEYKLAAETLSRLGRLRQDIERSVSVINQHGNTSGFSTPHVFKTEKGALRCLQGSTPSPLCKSISLAPVRVNPPDGWPALSSALAQVREARVLARLAQHAQSSAPSNSGDTCSVLQTCFTPPPRFRSVTRCYAQENLTPQTPGDQKNSREDCRLQKGEEQPPELITKALRTARLQITRALSSSPTLCKPWNAELRDVGCD